MNSINLVLQRMSCYGSNPAVYEEGKTTTYNDFFQKISKWESVFSELCINSGDVCAIIGDFSVETCSFFFAAMKTGLIVVPLTSLNAEELAKYIEISTATTIFKFDNSGGYVTDRIPNKTPHPLIEDFKGRGNAGLIVFSSGSTGVPKAILHDCECVMRKFVADRRPWKTVLFLLMDHFGGFNTFLGAFAYGGVAVCIRDRSPASICSAIEKSGATLLPTTPTFLNLLLTSGANNGYDLSSVKMITYGTEVMSEATLSRVSKAFPNAVIKQTYGLSEVGVLKSKSEDETSTWVKVGGEGFEVKVVDGLLWIRSEANMVGYLNAPSPFDQDGWMYTGDQVEIKGDYIRIIGRKSDLINVGGQKVFPAEVEECLMRAPNIKNVAVYGVPHQLMGQVVNASISLIDEEDNDDLVARLRKHCNVELAKYKIPLKFHICSESEMHTGRFKKIRSAPVIR